MNYRHIYHAGNFAEVFKHVLLIGLIQSLYKKEKPFCYIDTHAGVSSYDLLSTAAQKTQEYTCGILKLWQSTELHYQKQNDLRQNDQKSSAKQLNWIEIYFDMIKNWNLEKNEEGLRYYPGSPRIVRNLLRPQDKMILAELHPEDVLLLKADFFKDSQVAVHHMDGYQAIKAFVPPKEKRGLVFIDPPFEKEQEFATILDGLKIGLRHWSTGIFAIWYPIKDEWSINKFYRDLKKSGVREILACEMHLPCASPDGLTACGMIVIHPPWQWRESLAIVLPELCRLLGGSGKNDCRIEWLVTE